MSDKEEAKEGGEAEAAAKPKGKKKLIIIVAAVLLLVLGGVGGFVFIGGTKDKDAEEHHEEEEVKHYQTFELETFIVNLSENSSFLKVKILVEYDPAILAKAGADGHGGGGGYGGGGSGGEGGKSGPPAIVSERLPMIKDAVIRVLSSKKAEDVLTVEGKDRLKEELIEALNEATGLDEGPVVGIYFLEFVIQ